MEKWRAGCFRHQPVLEENLKNIWRYWPWLFLILLSIGGYSIALFQQQSQRDDIAYRVKDRVPVSCGFDSNPCEIEIDGQIFSISVYGSVTPLKRFKIILEGDSVENAMVSFSMIDMDMGINRFVFKQTAAKLWETPVVLPVCSARRKDWLAEFTIDLVGAGKIKIDYPFNAQ